MFRSMRMLVLLISLFFLSRCSGSSCDEFTVGSCNPDPRGIILALDLPNSGGQWELCNDLCSAKFRCTYWSLSCTNTSCLCSLLKYSYLHSCEVVGGGLGTDVEVVVLKKDKILLLCIKSFLNQLFQEKPSSDMLGTDIWRLWGSCGRGLRAQRPGGLVRGGSYQRKKN